MLLAALGAGVNTLIEKKSLGFPEASLARVVKAVDMDQKELPGNFAGLPPLAFLLDAQRGDKERKEDGRQGGSLSSADDQAKELRDNTLASLAREESKLNKQLSLAYPWMECPQRNGTGRGAFYFIWRTRSSQKRPIRSLCYLGSRRPLPTIPAFGNKLIVSGQDPAALASTFAGTTSARAGFIGGGGQGYAGFMPGRGRAGCQ